MKTSTQIALINFLSLIYLPEVLSDINVIDRKTNITVKTYKDKQASFGDDFPDLGMIGVLTMADPPHACTPLKKRAPFLSTRRHILLIARGGPVKCEFSDKVLNAQVHHYDAAIVFDNIDESELQTMGIGVNGSKVEIPSTFVSRNTGEDLKLYEDHEWFFIQIKEGPDFYGNWYVGVVAVAVFALFCYICIRGGTLLLEKCLRHCINKRMNRRKTAFARKQLKRMPIRKYKAGDYYDTCAICLDDFKVHAKIRVLPCDHVYHVTCIDPWLTSKKTCPVCKRQVIPDQDRDASSTGAIDDRSSRRHTEGTPLLHPGDMEERAGQVV